MKAFPNVRCTTHAQTFSSAPGSCGNKSNAMGGHGKQSAHTTCLTPVTSPPKRNTRKVFGVASTLFVLIPISACVTTPMPSPAGRTVHLATGVAQFAVLEKTNTIAPKYLFCGSPSFPCLSITPKTVQTLAAEPTTVLAVPSSVRERPTPILSRPYVATSEVFFSEGSAALSDLAKRTLTALVKPAAIGAARTIRFKVSAYTDPTGGRDINERLAFLRAERVHAFLVHLGIAPKAITETALPSCCVPSSSESAAALAAQRRVLVTKIGDAGNTDSTSGNTGT